MARATTMEDGPDLGGVAVFAIFAIGVAGMIAATFYGLMHPQPSFADTYVAPPCDSHAQPSIVVALRNSLDTGGVAAKLEGAGWVSIHTDYKGAIVTADCHLSAGWR